MGEFLTDPILIGMDDGVHWTLDNNLVYKPHASDQIVVPMGFVTDFASIPRMFWTILPKWGRYGRAAIVHDYLYTVQKTTREFADGILLEAMTDSGVGWVTRHTIFRHVRWWGWFAWNQAKKEAQNVNEAK